MPVFLYNEISPNWLDLEAFKNINFEDKNSPYSIEEHTVPRVTSVLSDMLHEEYLIGWANYIGRVKGQNNKTVLDEAAALGSEVHLAIENYLKFGIIEKFNSERASNAFNSFVVWWSNIYKRNVEILLEEYTLITPYCGGTLDLLIKVDGLIYLVDFKTSNHLSYKYHLQTAAYRRMLYETLGIVIDGIIILKLHKDCILFEEEVIDLRRYDHVEYINQCDQCFLSLLQGYYYRYAVQKQYDSIIK